MKFLQHNGIRCRTGQSLIEVMVAMSLLTVGFLGAVTLLSRSLALNRFTANNVTAIYLASEGIEIGKNMIDHDVFAQNAGQGAGWGSCLGELGTIADGFEADYETFDCKPVDGKVMGYGPSDYLQYHADTHLYDYDKNGGTATIFTREIAMGSYGSGEITVSSTVFWSGLDGAPQSIILEDHFYDWYSKGPGTLP